MIAANQAVNAIKGIARGAGTFGRGAKRIGLGAARRSYNRARSAAGMGARGMRGAKRVASTLGGARRSIGETGFGARMSMGAFAGGMQRGLKGGGAEAFKGLKSEAGKLGYTIGATGRGLKQTARFGGRAATFAGSAGADFARGTAKVGMRAGRFALNDPGRAVTNTVLAGAAGMGVAALPRVLRAGRWSPGGEE